MARVVALATVAVAAVLLVGTATPAAQARQHVVFIYAPRGLNNSCVHVLPLKRVVRSPALLRGAMQALVEGPTKAERRRGYGGWFSADTAGSVRSVRLWRGTAYVDFRNFAARIPNASTSCGSVLLLAQLDRTAKQFPAVKRTVYSFKGSRHAFYEWLQREPPEE